MAAAVPLAAVVALYGFDAWIGVGEFSGAVSRVLLLSIGTIFAVVLAWVLRRREDLVTPHARWLEFIGRHDPAPDDIVCLFRDDVGLDLASVVVDRAADRIVFERCHAPRRWPIAWGQSRASCRVSEIEGYIPPWRTRDDEREESFPLVVITPRGRATIPADADGVGGLVAFLQSRVEPVRRPAVDHPDSMNAVVGGAIAGLAAGAVGGLAAGVTDGALAWWFIGGTAVGAFLTRALLVVADQVFGVDLASPMGGAVKGATIALRASMFIPMLLASGDMGLLSLWLLPAALAVGAFVGGLWGSRRSTSGSSFAALPVGTFAARVASLPGAAAAGDPGGRIAAVLAAQWTRRVDDPQAYVGDLLYEAVHEAHLAGRAGAWQPEVEVSEGEVRVRCVWKRCASGRGIDDPAADTTWLFGGLAEFARFLAHAERPPWRLVVAFEAPPGVAGLLGSTHPAVNVCRKVGVDGTGSLSIGIRDVPPSPASLPRTPFTGVERDVAPSTSPPQVPLTDALRHAPPSIAPPAMPPLADVLRTESACDESGDDDVDDGRVREPTTS